MGWLVGLAYVVILLVAFGSLAGVAISLLGHLILIGLMILFGGWLYNWLKDNGHF